MANDFHVTEDGDDMESANYYVCAPATQRALFDDDLYDFCCKCGIKVRYRPHGPTIPKKICLPCAAPDMNTAFDKGELEVITDPKSVKEVERILKRQ